MPVTSGSWKRLFYFLAKTELRSCMTQDGLESMTLVFVEQELATELNPEDIIEQYAMLF